jgi:hypothetical protein
VRWLDTALAYGLSFAFPNGVRIAVKKESDTQSGVEPPHSKTCLQLPEQMQS